MTTTSTHRDDDETGPGHWVRRPGLRGAVAAILAVAAVATGLALAGPTPVDAADRPLPERVPAGSIVAPYRANIFEHQFARTSENGFTYAICTSTLYLTWDVAYLQRIQVRSSDGERYAQLWMESTNVDPRTGVRTQRGTRALVANWNGSVFYGSTPATGYVQDKPNVIDPGDQFAYYDPNYTLRGTGRTDSGDPTSGCSPSAKAARNATLLSYVDQKYWWTDGPLDNRPPLAAFQASVSKVTPREVSFTNTSTDPESSVAQMTYTWDFGDGSGSTQRDPVHRYAEEGDYQVELTARDASGLTHTTTQTVEVGGPVLEGALFPFPSGDAIVKEGEDFGLRLRVENEGEEVLTGVRVESVSVTPTDPELLGRATITPKAGGEVLSGTLGTAATQTDLDFADYEVRPTVAGTVQVRAVVTATEPDGSPLVATITWDLEIRPAPITVELDVRYAEPEDPDADTPPPAFDQDNNDDGVVDGRDHRVEIDVTATNTSDETITSIDPSDPADPVSFLDKRLGGGAVGLLPIEGPAQTQFGDLEPGESQTLTFTYEAIEPVWADARAILRGVIPGDPPTEVAGNGTTEVKLDTDLALEAWMDLEERPYTSGQVVRLNGHLKNVMQDRTLPDGTIEEAENLAVVVDPIVEGNAGNGYVFETAKAGPTPQGNVPIVLAPGEEVDVSAIVATTRLAESSTAEVRYLVRAWAFGDDDPEALGQPIDQSRVAIDDEDGRGTEFTVRLAPDDVPIDPKECETKLLDAIITCNLWTGLRSFGTGLGQLAVLTVQGVGEIARAQLAVRAWYFTMLKNYVGAIAGDEAAQQRIATEIEVQLQVYVQAKLFAPEALDAVGGAVVQFFAEAEEVLETGDTDTMVAWTARFIGENPDLGLAAIAKLRAARTLFSAVLPSGSQTAATRELVAAADEATALRSAELEGKVEKSLAEGRNPATDGTFVGDEVITNSPRIFRGIYGARKTEVAKMLELAASEDILIAFRSRAPRAADLIRDGLAWLKPMDVKTKGVSEIDINYLGYRRESKDLVELVEPPIDWRLAAEGNEEAFELALDEHMEVLKQRHPEIAADPVWASEVRDRLKTRTKEWGKELPNFSRYNREGIKLEFGYAEQGLDPKLDVGAAEYRKARVTGGELIDPFTGRPRRYFTLEMSDPSGRVYKPITGDIDIVAILNADRTPITDPAKRIRIYQQLQKLVGMQHGDSFTWINGEGQIKFLREHVAGKPGSEALVVAGNDAELRMGYFEERLSTAPGPDGAPVEKTSFHLLTGGPGQLRTNPVGGTPISLPSYLDRLSGYTELETFYVPGALAKLLGLGEETVPKAFDPGAPAVRPTGDGGLETYEPGAEDPSRSTRSGVRTVRAVEPSGDPSLDEVLLELAEAGIGPAAPVTVGAAGGRWTPIPVDEAIARRAPGTLDQGITTALTADVAAGDRTLPVLGLAELAMATTSPWFRVGDELVVDPGGAGEERHRVTGVAPLTLATPLAGDHPESTQVVLVPRAAAPVDPVDPTTPVEPSVPTSPSVPGGSATPAGSGAGGAGGNGGGQPAGTGSLPRTGSDTTALLQLALVLVMGGAVLVVRRRRAVTASA